MDNIEYRYVMRQIRHLTGIDLACYKAPQMQRRLGVLLVRSGHATWRSYFEAAGADPRSLGALRDYLTINVSSFFRDAAKYAQLRRDIIPSLLEARANIRIWSAGCSRGQEPYTLAMILSEMASRRHALMATDIDEGALTIARNGGPYPESEITVEASLQKKYLSKRADGWWVGPSLRRRIKFDTHNLLGPAYATDLDLIVCRNVVIYFSAEVKIALYKRFSQSLRPGGVLFLGATELIPKDGGVDLERAGISFYRKPRSVGSGEIRQPVHSNKSFVRV